VAVEVGVITDEMIPCCSAAGDQVGMTVCPGVEAEDNTSCSNCNRRNNSDRGFSKFR
jgi:hypothetical protein